LENLYSTDNLRHDFRSPQIFRVDLADYAISEFDQGNLVAKANQHDIKIQNSAKYSFYQI